MCSLAFEIPSCVAFRKIDTLKYILYPTAQSHWLTYDLNRRCFAKILVFTDTKLQRHWYAQALVFTKRKQNIYENKVNANGNQTLTEQKFNKNKSKWNGNRTQADYEPTANESKKIQKEKTQIKQKIKIECGRNAT